MARKIPLQDGMFAIVDSDDYERLVKYSWRVNVHGYVATRKQVNLKRSNYLMHRLVNKTPKGKSTDHKNHNKLDNRKENLRTVSQGENKMNSRPMRGREYKGVGFQRDSSLWAAYIRHNGKRIHLGSYIEKEEAARAYNEKARELFGEYAHLNEVSDGKFNKVSRAVGVSGFVGVTWNGPMGKWVARVSHNGKRKEVGYYEDKYEAAVERDIKNLDLNGDTARFNFPELIEEYKQQLNR